MVSKKTLGIVLFVMVVLAGLLTACAQAPAAVEKIVEKPVVQTVVVEKAVAVKETVVVQLQATPEPKQLVIGASFDLTSLDPGKAYETTSNMVHKATYNTLVTWPDSEVSKVVPDLAEKWEASADGKTFTFHLRKGVKFHTGNELTAADVKWTWERAMALKGNPSFLFEGIKSIEAPDDYTVVVTKEAPDPAFLAKVTFPVFAPLDSKAVQEHGGTNAADADKTDKAEEWLNQNSAGTGPFILKKWEQNNEVVVEKFADYFRGPAYFDKVVYKHIADAATQKLTLEAGGLDIATEVKGDQIEILRANPKIRVVEGIGTDMFFLLMNFNPDMSNGIMNKEKVRQAVRYAIDYEGIKQIVGGPAVSPPTVLPVGFAGAWTPDRSIKRDLEKSKALLAEAGYPDGFEIDLEYPTKLARSGVDLDTIAEKVQADLAEVGIKVNLKPGEVLTVLANYRAGTEGFGFWYWSPDYYDSNDYLEFLPERLVGKRAQWTDANADQTIKDLRDAALVEMDQNKRNEQWSQIQQYLQEKGPWAPLIQPGQAIATAAALKGYVFNPSWKVDPYLLAK